MCLCVCACRSIPHHGSGRNPACSPSGPQTQHRLSGHPGSPPQKGPLLMKWRMDFSGVGGGALSQGGGRGREMVSPAVPVIAVWWREGECGSGMRWLQLLALCLFEQL